MVALLLASCAAPVTSNVGDVRGTVRGWPSAPLGGGTVPARGATVRFLDGSGHQVASAVTDAGGAFHASMPAGRYLVRVAAFGRDPIVISVNGDSTKGGDVYVTVDAGVPVTLDIVVDTGIR